MNCKRCGRELKNEKSILRGYGFLCAKHEGIEEERHLHVKKGLIPAKPIRGYFNGEQ